jgi:hypothetical protein
MFGLSLLSLCIWHCRSQSLGFSDAKTKIVSGFLLTRPLTSDRLLTLFHPPPRNGNKALLQCRIFPVSSSSAHRQPPNSCKGRRAATARHSQLPLRKARADSVSGVTLVSPSAHRKRPRISAPYPLGWLLLSEKTPTFGWTSLAANIAYEPFAALKSATLGASGATRLLVDRGNDGRRRGCRNRSAQHYGQAQGNISLHLLPTCR